MCGPPHASPSTQTLSLQQPVLAPASVCHSGSSTRLPPPACPPVCLLTHSPSSVSTVCFAALTSYCPCCSSRNRPTDCSRVHEPRTQVVRLAGGSAHDGVTPPTSIHPRTLTHISATHACTLTSNWRSSSGGVRARSPTKPLGALALNMPPSVAEAEGGRRPHTDHLTICTASTTLLASQTLCSLLSPALSLLPHPPPPL